MKRYIIALGLLYLGGSIALAHEETMLARVTVYWASGGSGSDSWTRNHVAASGARLRAGHCAVDPRRIPYGSQVILPDGTLVAVDTGSAVRSRRAARLAGRSVSERSAIVIDRFFETKGQAMSWANRNPQFMTVRIDSPNESLSTIRAIVANNSRVSTTVRNSAIKAPVPRVIPSDRSPKLVAQNTVQSRSHYGRAVANLP